MELIMGFFLIYIFLPKYVSVPNCDGDHLIQQLMLASDNTCNSITSTSHEHSQGTYSSI